MCADGPTQQVAPGPHAASFVEDEIVVATPHLDLVLNELGGRGRELRRDERLGLVQVKIDSPKDVAAALAEKTAEKTAAESRPAATGEPLDIILTSLRLIFEEAWKKWYPVLGKNRGMAGGEGSPYVKPKDPTAEAQAAPHNDAVGPMRPYDGPTARDRRTGGAGVRIGLLDTRVARHPALAGVLTLDDVTALPESDAPRGFREGHATFLAGLIHSYAPDALIDVRPCLFGQDATAQAWDVAVGLLDLVRPENPPEGFVPPDLVVMALGCFTKDGRPPLVLQRAVDMVRDDVVILCAGGNYADLSTEAAAQVGITGRTPMWPAALDGVTAVGSHDGDGDRSTFSPHTPWIDLLGPGENLSSSYLSGPVLLPDPHKGELTEKRDFGGYARWGGSSMAVAVAAARLAARREGREPVRRTLDRLLRTGDVPYLYKVPS